MSHLVCGGRLVLLLAALILGSAPCLAQQPAADGPKKRDLNTVYVPAKGSEFCRYLLQRRGLEPLQSLHDLNDPKNTVIVLLGPKSVEGYMDLGVSTAVNNGASLLVAAGGPVRAELRFFNVHITADHVLSQGEDCYHKLKSRPFVRPIQGPGQVDYNLPQSVFKGIDESGPSAIATNSPAVLRLSGNNQNSITYKLAGYPERAEFADSRRLIDAFSDLFAAGGTYGNENGRFLILADHSIFNNGTMLTEDSQGNPTEDNFNREFLHSCMDWLQGQVLSTKKKKYCLFIEDGEIKTTFDLPKPDLNWLSVLSLAMDIVERHGNSIASEQEERNVFNETFFKLFTLREVVRFGLILLSVALLIVGLVRLVRSRATPDPARTLITPELAAMIPRGTALQQRFEGQLAHENLYEAARSMARDFFGGLDAAPDEQGQPPALQISFDHPNARELHQKIMRVWQVGFGTEPVAIGPGDWRGLLADLEKILEDADHGWWKFLPLNKA